MKKFFIISFLFFSTPLLASEDEKEKKIAKFVMENIQTDYVNCYSFYKVAAESFKKASKEEEEDSKDN